MEHSGTFPFGWIRGYRQDNWQIFWDPASSEMFLKGALSGEYIKLGKANSWQDARKKTGRLLDSPDSLESIFS